MRFGNLKSATGSLLAVLGICALSRSATAAVGYTAQVLYTIAGDGGSITIPDSPGYALGGQVAAFIELGNGPHAVVYKGNRVEFDLNPAGFLNSRAYATSGTQQVGNGALNQNSSAHALMWSGNASSMVDLNPAGYGISEAWGTNGTQQVGDAGINSQYHAGFWNGTAASFVDLHPAGFTDTTAQGTTGTQQVGGGFGTATGGASHALLWTGTAASYVDLNPAGYADSGGSGIGGNQQVGYAHLPSDEQDRAMLWKGSAASAIDLTPPLAGFESSDALATNGSIQAGYGRQSGSSRALAWSGTADSVVNLHALLPATMFQSIAGGVDANGDIFGTANDASNVYAVEWIPVPEPATVLLIAPAGLLIRRRASCTAAAGK